LDKEGCPAFPNPIVIGFREAGWGGLMPYNAVGCLPAAGRGNTYQPGASPQDKIYQIHTHPERVKHYV